MVTALVFGACSEDGDGAGATLSVSSAAFENGGSIPAEYTCEGDNVSPPLEWDGVPSSARQLAVVVVDEDAPGGVFVHWTLWGIDRAERSLARGGVPGGAAQGQSSSGKAGWVGPCPPNGDEPHRYVFTVLALERAPAVADGASPNEAVRAIERVAIVKGSLEGRFGR